MCIRDRIRERYGVCMRRDSAHYGSTAVLLLLARLRTLPGMVIQQYCCYCPSGAPAACGVPRRTNMTKTCCPCLPCDKEGGLCRTAAICPGWNSACDRSSCPCREAGREKESRGCGQDLHRPPRDARSWKQNGMIADGSGGRGLEEE